MSEKTMSAKHYIKVNGCEHDGSYVPVSEVYRLMSAYHAHELAAIRKAVEALGFYTNPSHRNDIPLVEVSEVLAILDAHKPKT